MNSVGDAKLSEGMSRLRRVVNRSQRVHNMTASLLQSSCALSERQLAQIRRALLSLFMQSERLLNLFIFPHVY